jgi:hypothetical protein
MKKQQLKKITEDWHSLFPELGIYKPMHLLRRCGPLLVGICLRRSSGEHYLPAVHICCLARGGSFIYLGLCQELLTVKTQAQDYIPVKWHEKKWCEAADRLSHQSLLPLAGPLSLAQLIHAFKEYPKTEDAMPHNPNIYRDWLLTLAWAGREEDVQRVLTEAERDMATWPERIFLYEEGGLSGWLRRVREETSDPDRLRRIVEEELVKLKAEHLPAVDVSSWFVGPPPPPLLPKPPRRKPGPSVATRLRQVSRNCLHGAPVPPTLRALWEAGAEGEWLLQGAELELLTSAKEALESFQEDPEESPALAQAQTRLFEEMAPVAWSGEGHYLALWRFAPEQSWEQAATVALDEKVGFYCTAASLADHVVLALGEEEVEKSLAWCRQRDLHVSASVAEARARLRRLPSPEYRLHRYQQEEEARQRGEKLPEPAPTRTTEPQQLADLLGMSAEDARVEALLRTVEGPAQPLELECDEGGRVALLSFTQENLRMPLTVEGIHLGDSLEQVHSTLGAPSASDKEWERYDRQERGLRLDYRWGRVRSVTLLWLPAVPEPWR